MGHNTTTRLGSAVSLWLTLDMEKVEKNSAESDKIAHKLEEERLRLEQERLDSWARMEAAGGSIEDILQQGSSTATEVVESEVDEFFD